MTDKGGKRCVLAHLLALAAAGSATVAAPLHAVEPPPPETFPMETADDAAAFAAAGFKLADGDWRGCDDPGTASYVPGQIEQIADLNGDGQPEAVITEGSTFCYGAAGMGYALVSRNGAGQWKLLSKGPGFAGFLKTRGADNWPDLQVGGPGFCFPVLRWDGAAYKLHRREYEGKPC
ncbi:MAG TPA: hypothetical protein VL094_06525 [Sphingomonadaceae bacterium]|nr:hypothetical protein [Sphingomonadaceae bacterium]